MKDNMERIEIGIESKLLNLKYATGHWEQEV